MPISRDAWLSDTHFKRSSASSSHSQSDNISAKSRIRASLARRASAASVSLAFCSDWRRNCRLMTPNNTAKPVAAARPPNVVTVACIRHFASATGSIMDTSMTSG
jgi:hypothetical protein